MEVEKNSSLDSNWEKIYGYLKDGDWSAAEAFCDSQMRRSYHSNAFLTAVKCVRFWNSAYNEAKKTADKYQHAQKLIDFWSSFAGHFSARFNDFGRGVALIRRKVFSDALLDLLQTRHETPASETEENLLLQIGRCYKFLGDFTKALDILKKVYALDKHNAEVSAELADCFSLQGDNMKAKIFFSEAFYQDPQKINLNFIETIYIKRLADLLTNEYNIKKEELRDWIPVYATAFKIFNIRRELLSNELRDLKQRIQLLEDEAPEGNVIPRLIYAYCRLIFHLQSVHGSEGNHYEIGLLLNKIKALDSSVYNELIK